MDYTIFMNKYGLMDASNEEQKVFNRITWVSVFNKNAEVILFLNLGLLTAFSFYKYKSNTFAL